ncbi:DRD2 [Bugula neritina]|uniref:DRD2 n=1 Tax=Bugula neritina TaxID=10212 RepID=A0A7J7JJ04_BUGNE|nr:DRD2 [Bugula neritina]
MVMFILYSKILKVIRERATAKRGKQTKVKKTMSIKENHKELLFVKEPSSSSNGNDLKGTNSERPSTYHKQNNAKGKCLKNNFLSENHSPTLRNSSEEGDIMNTKEIPKLGSWHPQTDESVETFNGKIEPLYAEQSEHLCKHEYKTELNNNTSPHHRLVVSKSNYSKRDNHMANRKKSSKLLLLNNNLFQRVSFKKKDKPADRREQRAIITLVVVLIIFQVCWVPFFITNNVRAICEHLNSVRHVKMCTDIPDQLMSFFVWLGYINSMLNPVIYALLNVEYRKAFKQLLNCEEKKPRSANRL